MGALTAVSKATHKLDHFVNNSSTNKIVSKIAEFAKNVFKGGLIGATLGAAIVAGFYLKTIIWIAIFVALTGPINFALLGTFAGILAAAIIGGGFIIGAIQGPFLFSQEDKLKNHNNSSHPRGVCF